MLGEDTVAVVHRGTHVEPVCSTCNSSYSSVVSSCPVTTTVAPHLFDFHTGAEERNTDKAGIAVDESSTSGSRRSRSHWLQVEEAIFLVRFKARKQTLRAGTKVSCQLPATSSTPSALAALPFLTGTVLGEHTTACCWEWTWLCNPTFFLQIFTLCEQLLSAVQHVGLLALSYLHPRMILRQKF